MSRRHIAEAYLRIDRQEKRIARLISDNDLRSLPSANAVLRQMLWFLHNVEAFALTIEHEDRAWP